MAMLTVALLRKHTETTVRLPALSAAEGQDVEVRCRWIGREEYLTMAPPAPPGSAEWPREDFAEKAAAWFQSLPTAVQEARTQQARDLLYRVVAAAAVEPKLTLEQARQLGSDGEEAGVAILLASGILRPAAPAAGVVDEAQSMEEPAAVAA